MKRFILSAAAILLLAGCNTAPQPFGPAYNSEFGFTNTRIEQDRFRISYTSRDTLKSRDFALLRAAQIADNEGYSHFRVINGGTYSNGPGANISTGVNLGFGGRRNNRSSVGLGVDDLERAIEGHKVTEEIEVILLSNPPASSGQRKDPNIFSAQSVIRNIIPYGPATSPAQNSGQTSGQTTPAPHTGIHQQPTTP